MPMRTARLIAAALVAATSLSACAQGGGGDQTDAAAPCTAGLGTHFCDSGDQNDPMTGIDPAARSIGASGGGTH